MYNVICCAGIDEKSSRGSIKADKSPDKLVSDQKKVVQHHLPFFLNGRLSVEKLWLHVSASCGSCRTFRIVILPKQKGMCFCISDAVSL